MSTLPRLLYHGLSPMCCPGCCLLWTRILTNFIHRDISSICGFSRETLIAVTTDIESRELKRVVNMEKGLPAEHSRASKTDDIECMMRDFVGQHFTVKQVQYEFWKFCLEFSKILDPVLTFYYFTSAHDRFKEGPLPNFDEPRPTKKMTSNPRYMRAPRREQLGSLVPGCTSMIIPGSRSLRTTFHQVAVELPPPPGIPINAVEHSYTRHNIDCQKHSLLTVVYFT